MIQAESFLNVADNTGAKKIMCIRVLGNNKRYGQVGDTFIGVVKSVLPNLPLKRSEIVRAVIVRTKHIIKRLDGTALRFSDNAAVLVTADKNPRGTRVFGPIAREIRDKNYTKIISLANEVI
jgi:large subunit ribosomal protein L14